MVDWDQILLRAAGEGNVKVLKMALNRGANPNFKNNSEDTALSRAAREDKHECLKMLLPLVEINETDSNGWSALIWAAACGGERCVAQLLQAGAAQLTTNKGETALSWAARGGYPTVVALLLPLADLKQKNTEGKTPLMEAASQMKGPCVRQLVPYFDPNIKDQKGMTALMYAANAGSWECVAELLPISAGLQEKNKEGNSAADLAIFHGYDKISALINGYARAQQDRWDLQKTLPATPQCVHKGNKL